MPLPARSLGQPLADPRLANPIPCGKGGRRSPPLARAPAKTLFTRHLAYAP
jgi:hypothetical protein